MRYKGSVASAVFTCHPASPAISGRRNRKCLARSSPDHPQAADSAIWILCPSVHSQELFYESLLNWQPDALFLPEAEFAAVENVLPDPEIAAERLAFLMQIGRETGPTRSSWRHAQVSIKPRRNAERWNLRLPNSSAERPRRWKVARTTRGQRLRTRRPGHHPRAIRRPRRHCRSLFVAGADAVAGGIFRRPDRIAARVRHRYSNFRARFALGRHFARSGSGWTRAASFAITFASDDLTIDIEPDEEISNRRRSRSAKAGLRMVRKISAVHFRIAISESLRSAIWCSPRRNARSSSSA